MSTVLFCRGFGAGVWGFGVQDLRFRVGPSAHKAWDGRCGTDG